jgi:hypothetical protein
MGLDMYLTGDRYFRRNKHDEPGLIGERYRLGYWRKHPNLHGFIVEKFSERIDDCGEIPLSMEDVHTIIKAVEKDRLPITSGFFFGKSDGTEKERDLKVFRDAITWLEEPDEQAWRFLTYQASW